MPDTNSLFECLTQILDFYREFCVSARDSINRFYSNRALTHIKVFLCVLRALCVKKIAFIVTVPSPECRFTLCPHFPQW